MTDLIVLCADKKVQVCIVAVLVRTQTIGIRPISSVVEVMVGKNDIDRFHNARSYMAPRCDAFDHALVVFDQQLEVK